MDGLLLIYKESGMTSHDVVSRVGKKLGIKKIGHTGTLDPMATGVLVLCVGKATKLTELITSTEKEYTAEVTLGIETDTLDSTGKVLYEQTPNVTKEEIERVLTNMIGSYYQEVPIYSAVKVRGKKLYDYARNHESVNLPRRNVEIKELALVSDIIDKNGHPTFWIHCHVSKGTYIRSLIRDIAYALNTVGVMSELRRTRQGNFKAEDCSLIDSLDPINPPLISMSECLKDIYTVVIDKEIEKAIQNGGIVENKYGQDLVLFVSPDETPKAIYQLYPKNPTKLKPWKMLNVEK